MNIAKRIPLTQGKFALVDLEDYKKLSKYKWYAFTTDDGGNWYAGRMVYSPKKYSVRMHHEIIGKPPKGSIVDHIDKNGLNNCKNNLRFCSKSENAANSRIYNSPKSGSSFRGVYKNTKGNRWYSAIRHEGKLLRLGSFLSEKEAALAYDKKALQLKGDFAQTNFNWQGGQR